MNSKGKTVRYRREWYRKTLAENQIKRRGPGTGAGRPKKTTQPTLFEADE